MGKRQTRRSFSLPGELWERIKLRAGSLGLRPTTWLDRVARERLQTEAAELAGIARPEYDEVEKLVADLVSVRAERDGLLRRLAEAEHKRNVALVRVGDLKILARLDGARIAELTDELDSAERARDEALARAERLAKDKRPASATGSGMLML